MPTLKKTVIFDRKIKFDFSSGSLLINSIEKNGISVIESFESYFSLFANVCDISMCEEVIIDNIFVKDFSLPMFKEDSVKFLTLKKVNFLRPDFITRTQSFKNITVIDTQTNLILRMFNYFFRQDNFSVKEFVFENCKVDYNDVIVMEKMFDIVIKNAGCCSNTPVILSDCSILVDPLLRTKSYMSKNSFNFFVEVGETEFKDIYKNVVLNDKERFAVFSFFSRFYEIED